MPEFPDQFTAATSVSTTDYVFVNQTKATVLQLAQTMGSQPSIEWNGTDVAQFGSANNIGTPTNPALAFAAQNVSSTDSMRITFGNGTNANEGAIWWATDTLDWQSMRIRLGVAVDVSNPIQLGESIGAGIVIGGDATQGSGITITVIFDSTNAAQLVVSANSAYGVSDYLPFGGPVSLNGGGYIVLDVGIVGRLTDTAGYPPSGAMAASIRVESVGQSALAGDMLLGTLATTDWVTAGAFATNRIGVVGAAGTGLTATTGILITEFSVSVA